MLFCVLNYCYCFKLIVVLYKNTYYGKYLSFFNSFTLLTLNICFSFKNYSFLFITLPSIEIDKLKSASNSLKDLSISYKISCISTL